MLTSLLNWFELVYSTGLSSLVYRAGLEMMCNVALERRMGFLSSDEAAQNKSDMQKIMTSLKGWYLVSSITIN